MAKCYSITYFRAGGGTGVEGGNRPLPTLYPGYATDYL